MSLHWLEEALGREVVPDMVENHDRITFADLITPFDCRHCVLLIGRDFECLRSPVPPAPTVAELEKRYRDRRLGEIPLPDPEDIPDVFHTDLLAHLQAENYLDCQARDGSNVPDSEWTPLLDNIWYIVLDQGSEQPVRVWLVHEVEVIKAAVLAANMHADVLCYSDEDDFGEE